MFLESTTKNVVLEESVVSMDQKQFIEYLQHYGLTRQEAAVYLELLICGKQTGYEIAKETGISRSNAYGALAALAEKGAAYVLEESAKRYIPVNLEEFCENYIRRLQEEKSWMTENLPEQKRMTEGYITIEGEKNICDKVRNLLVQARERVYISCTQMYVEQFGEELKQLAAQGKKVVVITDGVWRADGIVVYTTEQRGLQIGVIVDSQYVLSGEYGSGSMNTCLYSGQKNFVMLFKTALSNEIKLIQLQKGEK